MPASPTLARPAPRVPTRGPDVVSAFVVVATAIAMLVAVSSLLFDRERVAVDVQNPTDYEITVAVRPTDGDAVLLLGTLSPGSTKTFTGVIDQGERWHFDFSYAGVDAGGIDVDGDAVTDAPVVIPGTVADALEQVGLGRTPG